MEGVDSVRSLRCTAATHTSFNASDISAVEVVPCRLKFSLSALINYEPVGIRCLADCRDDLARPKSALIKCGSPQTRTSVAENSNTWKAPALSCFWHSRHATRSSTKANDLPIIELSDRVSGRTCKPPKRVGLGNTDVGFKVPQTNAYDE